MSARNWLTDEGKKRNGWGEGEATRERIDKKGEQGKKGDSTIREARMKE